MQNDSGSTPLHYFCKNADTAHYSEEEEGLVAKLIKKGAKVNVKNSNGETPLHTALWSKNISVLRVSFSSPSFLFSVVRTNNEITFDLAEIH